MHNRKRNKLCSINYNCQIRLCFDIHRYTKNLLFTLRSCTINVQYSKCAFINIQINIIYHFYFDFFHVLNLFVIFWIFLDNYWLFFWLDNFLSLCLHCILCHTIKIYSLQWCICILSHFLLHLHFNPFIIQLTNRLWSTHIIISRW